MGNRSEQERIWESTPALFIGQDSAFNSVIISTLICTGFGDYRRLDEMDLGKGPDSPAKSRLLAYSTTKKGYRLLTIIRLELLGRFPHLARISPNSPDLQARDCARLAQSTVKVAREVR